MKNMSQGFTLIELMIVVAIIGILAAIAVPSYQTYTTKAKFTQVVHATAPFKLAVEVCAHNMNGIANCSNKSNGIPDAAGASGYVASVTTAAGLITATSQNLPTDYTYILKPTYDAATGQVTWDDSTGTCKAAGVC